MMKHSLIVVAIALLSSITVQAGPVSKQAVRQRAQKWMSKPMTPMKLSVADKEAGPYTIFNADDGQGYVIVSCDDRTEQILGYSDQGNLTEDNMPEGLRWLLQMYSEQIKALPTVVNTNSSENVVDDVSTMAFRRAPVITKHSIEPLLQTRWNQGGPYNLLCPRYYNEDGTQGDLSATGCVATAIAQVMGFYRYPSETIRMIPGYYQNYNTTAGKKSVLLHNIPEHSRIDWDNILPDYYGGETDEQKTAVAQLMYWVGLGCKMGYGASSAAGFSEGVKALINYFGYDDGTHIEARHNHSIQSWHDLLYNELATGHPIAFAGTNTGGAHAFVIDGYDVSGLFHLNWGWGGLDNGYFRIDVLAPDDGSGIGASPTPDGYNMGQEAIIGMCLPDNVVADEQQPVLNANDWAVRNGNTFFTNFVNWTGIDTSFDMGIAIVKDDGSLQILSSFTQHLSVNTFVGHEFLINNLSEGSYRLVPVSKRSSLTKWQTHLSPQVYYILAQVDTNGSVTLGIMPQQNITMTNIAFPGNHKVGDRQSVKATFHNYAAEYYREIHLLASLTDNKGEAVCRTQVTIPVDGETISDFSFVPNQSGVWHVWLATDRNGNEVIGEGSVEITEEGIATNGNLRYASHTVTNRSNGIVYGNRMQGTVTIFNLGSEPFDGIIHLWLFKQDPSSGLFYGAGDNYVTMHIDGNKRGQADYSFSNLELNANYSMSILYQDGGDITDGGLKPMGTTQPGVVFWEQNLLMKGQAPTTTVNPTNNVIAIDMRGVTDRVKSVRPNANPNTLYLIDASENLPSGLEGLNVVLGNKADVLRLTDGYPFFSPSSFDVRQVEYTRTTSGKWETLSLPFAVSQLPVGVEAMELSSMDPEGIAYFTPVNSLGANIPYLIKGKAGEESVFTAYDAHISATQEAPMVVEAGGYRYQGVTVGKKLTDGYLFEESSMVFLPLLSAATIPAFHAYFTASQPVERIVIPMAPTTIHALRNVDDESVVFDLSGRRFNNIPKKKGIYIINGKKTVIK